MRRGPSGRVRGSVLLIVVIALGIGASLAMRSYRLRAEVAQRAARTRVPVQRTDLFVTLKAGGRLEAERKTIIDCKLENLSVSSEGRSFSSGGQITILDVVPEGATVQRDEVLCRLDSSNYEELVRQQELKLQQAISDHLKAELDVKAAEVSLIGYRDGELPQEMEALESQIILAEADLRRLDDRIAWSRTMLENGYISGGAYATEKQSRLKAEITLERLRTSREVLKNFGSVATLRTLQSNLDSLKTTLLFQDLRLRRTRLQLARFQAQVAYCTIRAPHEGFVVYANTQGRVKIEPGAQVYQKMPLFYLPDMETMEVQVVLHESVVDRVHEGMTARVRLEGRPEFALEGQVVAINPMPTFEGLNILTGEVRNYLGRIRLHSVPTGLVPGMNAEVEIETGRRNHALTVPTEAVVSEDGRDYCYVARPDGLERREITVEQGTRDLLAVTSGLSEGEEVVLDPQGEDDVASVGNASSPDSPVRAVPAP